MNLYRIDSPWSNKYPGYVIFKDSQSRLNDFFIDNKGSDKFLQYTIPRGVSQSEIKFLDIENADYLGALPSIIVFSEKAKNFFEKMIPSEIDFYKCLVESENNESLFYIAKIKRYLPLVDLERSSYTIDARGEKELDFFNTCYESERSFYIARDETYKFICIVSQAFVDLCEKEKLNIRFFSV